MDKLSKKEGKVLIIEDDEFLAKLLVDRIEKEGYNFALAQDGESGLSKARSMNPDLILLDIILPGMDGYEVLGRLKADPKLVKIPVLILSNLGQKKEIERGLQLGAVDFIIKAYVNLDEIMEKIKQILKL